MFRPKAYSLFLRPWILFIITRWEMAQTLISFPFRIAWRLNSKKNIPSSNVDQRIVMRLSLKRLLQTKKPSSQSFFAEWRGNNGSLFLYQPSWWRKGNSKALGSLWADGSEKWGKNRESNFYHWSGKYSDIGIFVQSGIGFFENAKRILQAISCRNRHWNW